MVPNRREAGFLFLGDVVALILALWIMLFVRYGQLPDWSVFMQHLQPFSVLFIVWLGVFYISGLYEKHTVMLKSRMPALLLSVIIVNTVIAIMFFYFVPYFGIAPKTNLFLYLIISLILIYFWRSYGHYLFGFREKQNALLIGSGAEMKELRDEVNNNSRYPIRFVSSIDLESINKLDFQEDVLNEIYSEGVSLIAIDLKNEKVSPVLPHLYNLIFSKVRFIDMYKVYEDIFDRVPISLLRHTWFLENISLTPKYTYDLLKRTMDIIISLVIGFITALLFPFIWLAIKLDDGGPLFFYQERIGKNNKPISIVKFRTMALNPEGKHYVTRVGKILRPTRLDEFPQFWNILKGDISVSGPRPEIPSFVSIYEKEIPFYSIRHLIKPGLTGWAQIYHEDPPKFDPNLVLTKRKLSYDLFYVKNRSFFIDLKIALRTLKDMVSRRGV